MKTIKNNMETELIIKNSKFITSIFKLNNEKDIEENLNIIKNKYNDANHNCYAYIYENTKKCSDDGEPSGTAGIPMLQVLEKKELSNILVTNAINNNELIELIKGKNIDIIFNYDNTKKIDYLLKDKTILNKEFKDNIKYNLNIDNDLLIKLKDLTDIEIIINNDIYIEN